MAESAEQYCQRTLEGITRKANHNKSEAMRCVALATFAALAAPLFITLGQGVWIGKVVPSVLSLGAAFATTWLQVRRPQLLWALYRGAQREIEDQLTRYRFRVGDFEHAPDPDKSLAERVADIALDLHHKWAPLVPSPESLAAAPTAAPKVLAQ